MPWAFDHSRKSRLLAQGQSSRRRHERAPEREMRRPPSKLPRLEPYDSPWNEQRLCQKSVKETLKKYKSNKPHQNDILFRGGPCVQRSCDQEGPSASCWDHVHNSFDPGIKISVFLSKLRFHVDILNVVAQMVHVVTQDHVKLRPMGNRVRDDISLVRHPDLHGQLLHKLFRNRIFPNLIIRYDGSVCAISSRRSRLDMR